MEKATYRVLYNFAAEEEGELSVSTGQIVETGIADEQELPEGWLLVKLKNSDNLGFVPKDYLEKMENSIPLAVKEIKQERTESFSSVNHSTNSVEKLFGNVDDEEKNTGSTNQQRLTVANLQNDNSKDKIGGAKPSQNFNVETFQSSNYQHFQRPFQTSNAQPLQISNISPTAPASFSSDKSNSPSYGEFKPFKSDTTLLPNAISSPKSSMGFKLSPSALKDQLGQSNQEAVPSKTFTTDPSAPAILASAGAAPAPSPLFNRNPASAINSAAAIFSSSAPTGNFANLLKAATLPKNATIALSPAKSKFLNATKSVQQIAKVTKSMTTFKGPSFVAAVEREDFEELKKRNQEFFSRILSTQEETFDNLCEMVEGLSKKLTDSSNSSNDLVKKLTDLDEFIDEERRKWKQQNEAEKNADIMDRSKELAALQVRGEGVTLTKTALGLLTQSRRPGYDDLSQSKTALPSS